MCRMIAVMMIASCPGITQEVPTFVRKGKNCQMSNTFPWENVSTCPEADISDLPHVDCGYYKDQGNILVIVVGGSSWMEATRGK